MLTTRLVQENWKNVLAVIIAVIKAQGASNKLKLQGNFYLGDRGDGIRLSHCTALFVSSDDEFYAMFALFAFDMCLSFSLSRTHTESWVVRSSTSNAENMPGIKSRF